MTRSPDDRLLLRSKYLVQFAGRRIDLHEICDIDLPQKFHNHPANAIRIILKGSYIEQLSDGSFQEWKTGMTGYVPGTLIHRIHQVTTPCYTLWIRGKNQFKVKSYNITKFM